MKQKPINESVWPSKILILQLLNIVLYFASKQEF